MASTAVTTEYRAEGRILRGVGGLYTIRLDAGDTPLSGKDVPCRAKGAFRHDGVTPLVGDLVSVRYTEKSLESADATDVLMEDILSRRNALIRPAMANLDYIYLAVASASPAPMTDMLDKMLSIAEYHRIEAAVVVGKCELDRETAEKLREIYTLAGYPVFLLSAKTGEGIDALRADIAEKLPGHTAAFSGASGVGKSSLMNALFPSLELATSEVSRKIERGKHTTRQVELFPLPDGGYLADTPGFSMLNFTQFDFFGKDDLPETMREFRPFLGKCRYTSCTHTREGPNECAVTRAVRDGNIAPSRHASFLAMYDALKNKHDWD